MIDDVRAATGVKLDVENTGGNTYVLSGRLEDGSWLVAGDGEAGDTWWDQADRHREEAENGPQGWYVGVYHNQVEDNPDGSQGEYWGYDPKEGYSVGPFHEHQDMGARTHELPSVVRDTLASIPHGAKNAVGEDGAPPRTAPAKEIPDYEELVNPRDDLDDDYGDIFGKQSMRRTAFDWKNEKWDGPAGEDFPDGYHRSKTENGHHLTVYRVRRPDGFAWSIYAPHRDSDNPATMTMVDGAGHRYGEEMPSVEHAKAAAEEAYKRLYPIGTDTGPRESGVDYSDLGKFMEGM